MRGAWVLLTGDLLRLPLRHRGPARGAAGAGAPGHLLRAADALGQEAAAAGEASGSAEEPKKRLRPTAAFGSSTLFLGEMGVRTHQKPKTLKAVFFKWCGCFLRRRRHFICGEKREATWHHGKPSTSQKQLASESTFS